MNKVNPTTKKLVLSGIMIALATLLSLIVIHRMPQGGSVTPASTLPLMLIAMKFGAPWGILCGAVYGILQIITGASFVGLSFWAAIGSMLLDYILSYALVGLCGLFKDMKFGLLIGAFVGTLGRFFANLLAGVILWAEYAGEMNPWLYSTIYNGSFMGVEFLITVAVLLVGYKAFDQFVKQGI
jgi:thiamine transporter